MPKLLFDLSTIVTLISDISHDCVVLAAMFDQQDEWDSLSSDRYQQLKDELDNPVLSPLIEIVKDHPWFTTQATLQRAKDLIENFGSITEIQRFKYLRTQLVIIPDNPSDKALALMGRIWTYRDGFNRKTIGTAHRYGFCLITGNKRAVSRAINSSEVEFDFDFKVHRARCFMGNKYTPIKKN